MRNWSNRTCLVLALAASGIVLPATSSAQAKPPTGAPTLSPELTAVRAALTKYADPYVAIMDGFLSTVACVDFPKGAMHGDIKYPAGAMGVHFVNMGNVGPKLDPEKPQVLIYEPVGDKLQLVAAEWFVPEPLAAGVTPSIFGQKLFGPMDGHEPIMPKGARHYDLHVWLWKENPSGVFISTNTAVKCAPNATYTVRY